MKRIVFAAALSALACAAVAADARNPQAKPADPKKAEIAALEKEWSNCNCGYGLYTPNWGHRYGAAELEPWDEARVVAAEKRGLEIRRRLVELAPDDPARLAALGEVLMYYGQERDDSALFKEALGLFRKAVGIREKGRPDRALAEAMYWLADAQFALGDRAAAQATLEALVAKKIPTWGRNVRDWSAMAASALFCLKGCDVDAMRLPFDNGSKAFPEPKQAKYTEKFAKLGAVRLVLRGVKEDDVRILLLKKKLGRMGATFSSDAPFVFDVALDPAAPVAEKEGYELRIGDAAATVRARDGQGVLWGIISFLQLVRHEPLSVRQCEILDWPDAPDRGWLNHYFDTGLEYLLFVKGNSCCYQNTPTDANYMTPLRMYTAGYQAKMFRSFGLTLYYGLKWISHAEQMAISVPATLRKRIDVCRRFAAWGAGVYFPFDDIRYPLLKVDREKYGIGANCDAKHINDVFLGVVKDYPDFRFIFCPPFYWGPDAPASYPEDRENYLRSLGEHLDPRIDIYWTGAQVKGYEKKKCQVEWFAKLTKRKPSVFQNVIGPHNFLDYMVDPIPWNRIHYDGFVKDIGPFHNNSNWPSDLCQLSTECDWLWNSRAYDGPRSIREGVAVYVGQGVTEPLTEALDDLSYFDRYRYGEVNVNIMFENAADLEKKLAHVKACYARACEQAKRNGAPMYGRFASGIGWAEKIVKAAKNPPDLLARYRGQIAETIRLATAEAQVDTNRGDVVLAPTSLAGIVPTGGTRPKSRFVKFLRGAQTADSTVSFQLQCDPFPPTGDYTLTICGLQDETPEENGLRISVNGTVVYDGECGFPHSMGKALFEEYATRDFTIPFASLKRYNTITISCATPGYNKVGTPYIGLNYIVVRKGAKRSFSGRPKFAWRGYMLDCARHFFTVGEIKRELDAMAMFNLNVFHWHLTDSEGWRFPVDAYPELVKTTRPVWGRNRTRMKASCKDGCDSGVYGPYSYTKDEIRDVIAHAAARGIRIVPEIELPGHAGAAIRAYPELACVLDGKPCADSDHVCAASDEVLRFYEKVLDEVCAIFPGEVVHIGGDECSMKNWRKCPRCQALMKREGMKDVKELQKRLTVHFAKYLEKKGSRPMGWDEIMEAGDLPKNVIVHSWRGAKAGIAAAQKGYDVVMSPTGCCYLDYDQGLQSDPKEYASFGSVATAMRLAAFDPCMRIPEAFRGHVLGAQANCWTEFMHDLAGVEWRTWPRLAALADVLWNGPEADAKAFAARLEAARARLQDRGIVAAPIGPLYAPPRLDPAPRKVVWKTDHHLKMLGCPLDRTCLEYDPNNYANIHRKIYVNHDPAMASGAYRMETQWNQVRVTCADRAGEDRALAMLRKLAREKEDGVLEFPGFVIED